MAPREKGAVQRRQTSSQNEHVYQPGKVGRKTGLVIPETEERDEDGFEKLEDFFNSPEKEDSGAAQGHDRNDSDDEQDMEIDDGSEMGPATALKLQHRSRPSLPRSRSPIKTNLRSPARRLGPPSSPVHTRDENVARKLKFPSGSQKQTKPLTNGHANTNGAKAQNNNLTNGDARSEASNSDDEVLQGRSKRPHEVVHEEEEDEQEEPMEMLDADNDDVNMGGQDDDPVVEDDPVQPDEEEEEEESTVQEAKPKTAKRRGRKPKALAAMEPTPDTSVVEGEPAEAAEVLEEEPVKKKRGRPKATSPPQVESEPAKKASKRGRPARISKEGSGPEEEEPEDKEEARETKRQRTEKKEDNATLSKPTTTKEKGKPGRKRKSSGVGVDSPAVHRGPPLPKARGLVALRREDPENMRYTRSGRVSYRPLEYWKGDRIEYDSGREDAHELKPGQKVYLGPVFKGVVRHNENEETVPVRKRRGRPVSGRSSKSGRASLTRVKEEEPEREDWEHDPGRMTGDVIYWRPEYETAPPQEEDQVEVVEEDLAIAEPAIQLKDIKDATFKFAKTLTLPFFGAGVVDLPARSEKRTKNCRKMQMVFFVHQGSVRVEIAQTTFTIAKGGQFFVPRGNHYSIANDTNKPARIFFAQGCEMLVQPEEDEEGS
ncbi:Mif2/CENP-C like-domain-containing protein [Xylariomycetidae sp. FL2044]|nr:Mif2/CENP-C like-domain-containing protein [Xylariomycetidae sp. FL2044]